MRTHTKTVKHKIIAVISAATVICIGTASAQDQPCMPGGICCAIVGQSPSGQDDRRCGTLEEFQRYAKIVCLKGDATENKGLAKSIEAWGRCTAASIAASRVEATQQANVEAHEHAMEAQRQLREMGVGPNPGTFRTQPSTTTSAGVSNLSMARNAAANGNHAETTMKRVYVHGVPVEVFDKDSLHHIVTTGDKVAIRDNKDVFVSIEGIYEGDGRVYVLIGESLGGNACPPEFQAIDMTGTEPKVSESFGGCAVMKNAAVSAGSLVVAFKALDGKSAETFSFRDGSLTSTKIALSLEPKGPESAPGGDLAAYVYQKPLSEVFTLRKRSRKSCQHKRSRKRATLPYPAPERNLS